MKNGEAIFQAAFFFKLRLKKKYSRYQKNSEATEISLRSSAPLRRVSLLAMYLFPQILITPLRSEFYEII